MIPSPPSTGSTSATLRSRRCSRHAEREAAGVCRSCRAFFCRECLVEHGGALYCGGCLSKLVLGSSAGERRRWLPRLWSGATLLASIALLWVLFFTVGSLLLRIPPDLHDGTLWKRADTGNDESPD